MENIIGKPSLSDGDIAKNGNPSAPPVALKVTGLHPKLADAVTHLLTEAKARGLSIGLQCGLRTAEEQDHEYAKGRTVKNPDGYDPIKRPMGMIVTKARAWDSWHNYGLAVDIVFKDEKGNWTWDKKFEDWLKVGVIGEMFGLRWGGRWLYLADEPHFEKRPDLMNVHEAKEFVFKYGIEALWDKV